MAGWEGKEKENNVYATALTARLLLSSVVAVAAAAAQRAVRSARFLFPSSVYFFLKTKKKKNRVLIQYALGNSVQRRNRVRTRCVIIIYGLYVYVKRARSVRPEVIEQIPPSLQ